jgi:hypothetical protein
LIAVFNAFPAENLGSFAAAIFIVSPVWGLRPFLAFLFETENVPNPTRVTFLPFLSDLAIEPVKVSMALPAATFDISAPAACNGN